VGEATKIEWTNRVLPSGDVVPGHTFNAWLGCEKISPACANCYAERDATMYGAVKWGGVAAGGERRVTAPGYWNQPAKWADAAHAAGVRALVFCASWADVFESWTGPVIDSMKRVMTTACGRTPSHRGEVSGDHTPERRPVTVDDLRCVLFRLIARTAHGLDWLLLTKRPDKMAAVWPGLSIVYETELARLAGTAGVAHPKYGAALKMVRHTEVIPNAWPGATVEDQRYADYRLPHLKRVNSPRRFLSVEPQTGAIDFGRAGLDGIAWVIGGGESGHNARPAPTDWYRGVRDQAKAAGCAYFFKQFGEWAPCSMGLETEEEERVGFAGTPHEFTYRGRKSLPIVNVNVVTGKNTVLYDNGTFTGEAPNGEWQGKYGKKVTGRLLDGATWDEIPPSLLPAPNL